MGITKKLEGTTLREIKDSDNVFNPILQKYNNKEHKDFLRTKEIESFINVQAYNFETYDIINLNEKLKRISKVCKLSRA